ncbi:MAG: metal-dependent transcriptional regulator [Clostridiales Family XIII bacterium]|jgi:Mn-dependent DtxR family transcriptional regulator|nr:metal-dependent transcriptional regulator [Clostridiales Family XIII bacterium]
MEELSPSIEDCLRTIYLLRGEDAEKIVRVSELAKQMNISMACVSRDTKLLAEKGLIQKNKYRGVFLTPKGEKQAAELSRRHSMIRRFLNEVLHVDRDVAEKNACDAEHILTDEVYRSMCECLADEDAR